MKFSILSSVLVVAGLYVTIPAMSGATMTGNVKENTVKQTDVLSQRQQAIVSIAAHAAAGDLDSLSKALEKGLNTGMTINDGKEVLVQLYAYAGFPRSLNALGTFMKVLESRKERGIEDEQGSLPEAPIPQGDALWHQGTANQTALSGRVVEGPLFDFAPAVDEYLKVHLFGDIFSRDNLNWQDREVATIAMLGAMPGVDPQLKAHVGIAQNIGLKRKQLMSLADVLERDGNNDAAQRVRHALSH